MAPIAATIAASVAVGFGLALAKAGSERRAVKLRRLERRLGLLSGERSTEGLRRMVLAQADLAIDALGSLQRGEESERAIHEIRKAIKRLRALLKLLGRDLGEQAVTREDRLLRDLARDLAGAREATAMLESFDRLVAGAPRRLRSRRSVARLRRALEAERTRAQSNELADSLKQGQALIELRAFRARAGLWKPSPQKWTIEAGVERLYRRGRQLHREAGRGKQPSKKRMHEWRKRVKDLRYATEALQRQQQAGKRGRHSKRERATSKKQAKWLRGIAKRADELSELLGDEHDLALLASWVEEPTVGASSEPVRLGAKTRKELLKLIAKRRRALRGETLKLGKRLYRRPPKRFLLRLRVALS